jgi:hypothetical protein
LEGFGWGVQPPHGVSPLGGISFLFFLFSYFRAQNRNRTFLLESTLDLGVGLLHVLDGAHFKFQIPQRLISSHFESFISTTIAILQKWCEVLHLQKLICSIQRANHDFSTEETI